MSIALLLVGDRRGARPIGPAAAVVARARTLLGVDLRAERIELAGAELAIALDVEGDLLRCVHVEPRSNVWAMAVELLAATIGAVAIDAQTGLPLGDPAPAGMPARAERYELRLVPLEGSLGTPDDVWARLASSLGVSPAGPLVAGDGWAARATLSMNGPAVRHVSLEARWSDPAAGDELARRVVAVADAHGWVPFDPQRNDTVPG